MTDWYLFTGSNRDDRSEAYTVSGSPSVELQVVTSSRHLQAIAIDI